MSPNRAENNKRRGFPLPGLLAALALAVTAIIWQLLVQQEFVYEVQGTVPVVTELSAQATQLPRGVVDTVADEQALATEAASIVKALDVAVSMEHDSSQHATELVFTATAANPDQATAAVEVSIDVYRENRENALIADALGQLESTGVERVVAQESLEETIASLGLLGQLDLNDLVEEALKSIGLRSLAELSGIDGFEIMTGMSNKSAQENLLQLLDAEDAALADPDGLLSKVVGESTISAQTRAATGPSIAPVILGGLALAALFTTLAMWGALASPVRMACGLLVVVAAVWMLVAGIELRSIRAEARDLERQVAALDFSFADLDGDRLSTLDADLTTASDRADQLIDRMEGARLLPLRFVPVIADQLDAAEHLGASTAQLLSIGTDVVSTANDALARLQEGTGSRADLIERLDDAAQAARSASAQVTSPDSDNLIDPLAKATERFRNEQAQVNEQLEQAAVVTAGMRSLLIGDRDLLLIAGNTAEIRAGLGAFLSVGRISVSDGDFALEELARVGITREDESTDLARNLEPDERAPYDIDMQRNHGLLQPDLLWPTLGLTPRFAPNAQLGADRWSAIGRGEVEGAIYLDSVSLQYLLEITGPVEVDGRVFNQRNIVDYLLIGQYDQFEGDRVGRREYLRQIVAAVLDEFDKVDDPAVAFGPLMRAIESRRLILWSTEQEAAAAIAAVGADGDLAPNTLAVNIASMAGKHDPYLDIATDITAECDQHSADIVATVVVQYPEAGLPVGGLPKGVDGSLSWSSDRGLYAGLAVVNAPAVTTGLTIENTGMLGSGPDGMTRHMNGWFSLRPDESATLDVRLTLPLSASFVVPPTARGIDPSLTIAGEPVDVGVWTTHNVTDLCS